jgi:hypothetical protein
MLTGRQMIELEWIWMEPVMALFQVGLEELRETVRKPHSG